MTVHIENEFLTATFAEKGAELISLKAKENGLEYIWQADPNYWARHCTCFYSDRRTLKRRYVSLPKPSVSLIAAWIC